MAKPFCLGRETEDTLYTLPSKELNQTSNTDQGQGRIKTHHQQNRTGPGISAEADNKQHLRMIPTKLSEHMAASARQIIKCLDFKVNTDTMILMLE